MVLFAASTCSMPGVVLVDGSDSVPTYNLKAVVKETGVQPDTLRAWERRYGLPDPGRTAGGHRLYSRRDIETIKWLASREDEGLSISRAAELWKRISAEGRDPLQGAVVPEAAAAAAGPISVPRTATEIDELRQTWVDACLAFDEQRAEQVLLQAFALYPPEVVVLELLRKGVVDAGEGWCRGALVVEQEYFAAEMARRRIEGLLTAIPPPTRSGRVLLAVAPGERNTLLPLVLTFLLRRRGLDAIFVGASASQSHLHATVSRLLPVIVVFFAHRMAAAAGLLECIRQLQPSQVPVGYMGAVFDMIPGLRARIPGYFLGSELEDAVRTLEGFVAVAPPVVSLPPVPEDIHAALTAFRQRRGSIEAAVWERMGLGVDQHDRLAYTNERLGDAIVAALRLGDIGLLGADLVWLKCVLEDQSFDDGLLREYVLRYCEAAKEALDPRGDRIVDWLLVLARC